MIRKHPQISHVEETVNGAFLKSLSIVHVIFSEILPFFFLSKI